jgi:hypothetical protein
VVRRRHVGIVTYLAHSYTHLHAHDATNTQCAELITRAREYMVLRMLARLAPQVALG